MLYRHAIAGFALAGLALAGAGSAATAKELKLAHFVSPKHPMHRFVMAPMAKDLAKVSGGKLTIKIFDSGKLGKGPVQQYRRVTTGVAQVGFGLHGYTSKQFPRTLLIELPGIAPDTVKATQMLWRARAAIQPEYGGIEPLALWTNDKAVLITREKPVRSPADMKGMKIRVPGRVAARAVRAWGALPVFMPAPKIYNALSTGVIDGVFIGASGIRSFRLYEAGKYVTVGLPPAYAAFWIGIDRKVWNGLSNQERNWIVQVTGRKLSLKAASVYGRAGKGGLKLFAKQKTVIQLTPAQAAKFASAASRVKSDVLAAMKGQGIDGGAVLKAMGASN